MYGYIRLARMSSGCHQEFWQLWSGKIPTIIVWGCDAGQGSAGCDMSSQLVHLTCSEHCCYVSVSYIHRTKVFPVCGRQWEDVRTASRRRRQKEVVGSCDIDTWREDLQEMTIKSPPDPEEMEALVDRTLVRGEIGQGDRTLVQGDRTLVKGEIVSRDRIIHHQQSKSEEDRPSNYDLPPCHKQTRSDEVLNRSGPPPVPDNSPQSDCGNRNTNNSSSSSSYNSLGKANSKSMDTLLDTNYAINSINENKLHKCASQDNMKMLRLNGNSSAQNEPCDESTPSINANNTSSGISIMENLVREFGLQTHPSTNSPLLAGEQTSQPSDDRGPPPKYPGTGQNMNALVEGASSMSGDSDLRSPMSSGSLVSKSRSYESMQDSVTR